MLDYSDEQLSKYTKEQLIEIIKQSKFKVEENSQKTRPNKKKVRIDLLVDIARKEMEKHHDKSLTLEKLDLEVTMKWGLSHSLKNEYLDDVIKILEYNHGIILHSDEEINAKNFDLSVLMEKPYSKVSKMEHFMNILKTLEGENKIPVLEQIFIDKLVKSGGFKEEEARNYIRRMLREASIYESKPGHYNIV